MGETSRRDRALNGPAVTSAPLRFAYNTNSLREHDGPGAIRLLANLGYDAIELSLLEQHYDPLRGTPEQLDAIKAAVRQTGLGVIVGAGVPLALSDERFEPSLFHPDAEGRALRLRFLQASADVAAELDSACLVFCTGTLQLGLDRQRALDWLERGLGDLCHYATERGVRVALEPEPDHLIESLGDFRELQRRVGPALGMTLDVGHVACTEDGELAEVIAALLADEHPEHVQIEDIRERRHEHLPFGEGDLDFPPILRTFAEADYRGYLGVELSRHSHEAERRAAESLTFLRDASALLR
jgi:L-ribulose-5-phosphate 3-epimerase